MLAQRSSETESIMVEEMATRAVVVSGLEYASGTVGLLANDGIVVHVVKNSDSRAFYSMARRRLW